MSPPAPAPRNGAQAGDPWPRLSVAEIHDFDDRWDWIGGEDAMWGDYQDLLDQPHADEVITADVADRADGDDDAPVSLLIQLYWPAPDDTSCRGTRWWS